MEALRVLTNKLEVAPFFNTDYNKEFTKEFKVGDTVEVRYPQRFLIRDGAEYSPQGLTDRYTTVTCDQQFGIDFDWTSAEQALNLEDVRRRYIEPAMAQLANEMDSRCASWAHFNTNNVVGALGTTPTAYSTYLAARQRMMELACPVGDKGMIVTPGMSATLIGGNLTLFNPNTDISTQFREGRIGKASGFDWYESNNLYSQTASVWQTPGSVQVYGSNQAGNTLTIAATAGDTFVKGDSFSIAVVNAVNPMNRRSTGTVKHFILTENLTAVGGNVDVITFQPAIVGPGDQYQNVDALALTGAVLTLWPGTTNPSTGPKSGKCGIALHRDAFALVGVKLVTPAAVELASQTRDPATGLSVRFIRQYDPQHDRMVNRFDVLIGFGNLYADNCAVRVCSAS
jgi:hypothetical protein